ncbi:MAG: PadR family transcriptional regulator [Clostridiaceae bacterium]|nr:PadR family transcriptional regulator [Clostridiaceae bacterium]
MRISKELIKGSTSYLVLSVIGEQDMYGYQIIREIALRSEQVFSLNEGTLYPILHSLEKEKLLSCYWQESETGRKRKYYRITDKGARELVHKRSEWQRYASAVTRVTGGAALANG